MFGGSSRSPGFWRTSRGSGRSPIAPAALNRKNRRRGPRTFQPGSLLAFESLESRTLLTDLTQEISSLLNSGNFSHSTTLPSATLGSFLTADNVTISFSNISQQGSDWSGTASVTAASASLTVGSGLSAQIHGDPANNVPGFSGSYTLNNQPVGGGAYQFSADQFSLSVPKVLTASAASVQVNYTPGAPAGQELAQLGSVSATIIPFNNVSATVSNLNILDNGFSIGDGKVSLPSFSLAKSLNVENPGLTFSKIGYSVGGSLTGTIGLTTDSASLFPDAKAFTSSAQGFAGSYNLTTNALSLTSTELDLSFGKLLKVAATGLNLSVDASQTPPAVAFDAATVSLSSPEFPGATGSLTALHVDNHGFSVTDAKLTDASITLGKVLTVINFVIDAQALAYISSPAALSGTVSISADSASAFPTAKSFTGSVQGFTGSYNLNSQALTLSASELDLSFGQILKVAGTGLSLSVDPSQTPPAVSFDAATVALSSPDFPSLSGSLSALHVDNNGFSLGEAKLMGSVTLGHVLQITNFSIDAKGLSFSATQPSAPLLGSISIGADSAALFPDQKSFSATVQGFRGSYDVSTQALALSATQAEIKVSDILDVTVTGLGFNDQQGVISAHADTATATVPRLAGLTGSVTNLNITNDGFTVDSASLGATGTVSLGKVFSFTGLSATVGNFGYSISNGASFNGDFKVTASSVSLNVGSVVSASATGLSGTLSFQSSDFGHFTFNATSVDAKIGPASGPYFDLAAKNIRFDTNPASGGYVAQFGTDAGNTGSLTATVFVKQGLSFSGTFQNFAISAGGAFVTLPGFGVSLSLSTPTSNFQWPSWLPIQIQTLGLTWPNFSADPTNFQINLSASVNATIPGTQVGASGFVQNAIIDVGKLQAGQFPIVGIGGAGIGVSGTLFGAQVKAALFVAVLDTDANYAVVTDPNSPSIVHRTFFAGIDGALNFEGMEGVEVRLGLSQLGPLDGYIQIDQPQVLDPDTGLAITNFRAGIEFDKSLPSITDPKQLATNPDFQTASGLTLVQWKDQLEGQVAKQAKDFDQSGGNLATTWANMVKTMEIQGGATLFSVYATVNSFQLDGDILFDTTGKIEAKGVLTIGDGLIINGYLYADLSHVGPPGSTSKATILMLANFPGGAPILTTYGAVTFAFDAPSLTAPQPAAGTTPSQLGTGLALNGSTDYVSADGVNLNNTSFTVEFWAKRADNGRPEYVIGQGDAQSGSDLQLGFNASNDFIASFGGSTLSTSAVDNAWHQWAVTFDRTTGQRTIYEDGAAVGHDSAQPIQNASTTFWIGKSGPTFFNGSVDEVRVWSLARAAADIQANRFKSYLGPRTGLLADWQFNEGSGTTAADSSGLGHLGTLQGSANWTMDGAASYQQPQGSTSPQLGMGLTLNGSTDSVSANGVNLNKTSFTVEFWAKRNDTGRAENVIGQGDPQPGNDLQIGFDAANNFVASFGGSTLSFPTSDSAWHHWAVTFDQTTGQRTIYQDGVAVAHDTAQAIQNASQTLLIGQSGSVFFDGSVDEVRVWTVARAQADIQANMNQSIVPPSPTLLADWQFNEGQGTTAGDSSGNAHNGTLQDNPQWTQTIISGPPAPPFVGFTITVSGGADLTVPGIPVAVTVTGTAEFRADFSQASLQLNLTGQANIAPIGLGIGLAGVVHFDFQSQAGKLALDQNGLPIPELYGVLALEPSGLSQLSNIGLNVESAYAVLRFNTTANDIQEDLQIPGQSNPTKLIIPHQSASLLVNGTASFQVAGQSLFQIHGELDAYFAYSTVNGTAQVQLDALLNAAVILGPSNMSVISFDATGFLQISNAGIAAEFSLVFDAPGSQALESYGIDLGSAQNTFKLELNTTSQEVKFTTPSLENPSTAMTQPGAGTSVDIPAGPHNADGTPGSPEPYLLVDGKGSLNILNSFTLTGTFDLLAAPGLLSIDLDADLQLKVANTTLLDAGVMGGIKIYSAGAAAAIKLNVNTGLPAGYGLSLNAGFLFELNTTGAAQTLGGVSVPQGKGSYVLIHSQGDLNVGPFDINGTFDFSSDSAGVMIAVVGNTSFGLLGSVHVNGQLALLAPNIFAGQLPGVYGILQASLMSSPSLPGFSLSAQFQFEINTTNASQTVSGFTVNAATGNVTTGQQLTIAPASFMLEAGGELSIINTFDISGDFDLSLNGGGLSLQANATLIGFIGANLALNTTINVYPSDAQGPGGLVVDTSLSLSNGNLGVGFFSFTATPTLIVNTSPVSRAGIAPATFEVSLQNATLNVLGLTASGTLTAGVSNGIFEIDVPSSNPLTVSFFGLGNVSIYGYLRSDGTFSLTGGTGFDLSDSIGELYGATSITISNSGFSGSFNGGANVYTAFGTINVGSASGSLVIQGSGIHLQTTLYVIGIGFPFDFTIGQLSIPPSVPAIYWFSVPATAQAGGTVMLGAGANNGNGPASPSDYQWSVYDNGTLFGTYSTADPTIQLGQPGSYAVDLTVGSLSRTSTITVADVPPSISSLNLRAGYAYGTPITIAPTVLTASQAAQGALSYNWTVTKNGQPFQTSTSPTFTFTPDMPSSTTSSSLPPPDLYQVTLVVNDPFGGSSTSSGSFGVFDPNNIIVNTTQDLTALTPTQTSLRVALSAAADSSGLHFIKFDPSLSGQTVDLRWVGDTSDHGNSAFAINGNEHVVIDGSAAPGVTIQADPAVSMRLFYVAPQSFLELENVHLSGGTASGSSDSADGGAIYDDGSVNIFSSSLTNNQAVATQQNVIAQPNGLGGAIYVSPSGYLTADQDTFANNLAKGADGGLVVLPGSIFSFPVFSPGGAGQGGAIFNAGSMSLYANTIADNSVQPGATPAASPGGAGVFDATTQDPNARFPAYRVFENNIIALNQGANDLDINSNLAIQGGGNLVGTLSNPPVQPFPFISASGNPLLGPLADHGGGLPTFSLLAGSPAIATGIVDQELNVPLDARGYPRVYNGQVDVGAVERQPHRVSNTNDTGLGSLREAVNSDDDGEPISIAPTLAGKTITLTSGPIELSRNVTIPGLGASQLTITSGVGALAAPGLTGWWKGEGNANDSAGGDNGTTTLGGSVYYTPGKIGQAFGFFNGDVRIPDEPALNVPTFSVGGWFYVAQASGSEVDLASKAGTQFNGWVIRLDSNLVPTFSVLQSQTHTANATASSPISVGSWHYIAGTYDGTTADLYVDGQLAGTATVAGGYTPSGTPLVLGAASWYAGGYLTGFLDEFAYYNNNLNARQVENVYNSVSPGQIFTVDRGVTATIAGLTLADGRGSQGGAIMNSGNLTITDSVFTNDVAQGATNLFNGSPGQGGAIYNATGADLTVVGSTFSHDSAIGGAGTPVFQGPAGNGGVGEGGAIYNAANAQINIIDDTFASDSAQGGFGADSATNFVTVAGAYGGAIYSAGIASISNSTLADGLVRSGAVNSSSPQPPAAPTDGAEIYNESKASLALTNTIAAYGIAGHDVANLGTASGGHNLVMASTGLPTGLVTSTADPKLSPLQNNGGPTPTMVLQPGSPALGAGDAAPSAVVAVPGLVSWWKGDGNAQDTTGSNNGSVPSGVTYGPGRVGQAFVLDGKSGEVTVPNSLSLNTSGFSVGGWFNLAQAPASGSEFYLASKYDGNSHGWILRLSATLVPALSVAQSLGLQVSATSSTSLMLHKWYYIAASYDGTTANIYVNGVLTGSETLAGGYTPAATSLVIGAASWFAGGFTNGSIDEFSYYNRALAPVEVQTIVGAGGLPTFDQRGFSRPYQGSVDIGADQTQPYVVTNTNDSGPGSLRAAVQGDAAGIEPVLFDLGLDGQTITLTGGPIEISHNLTIVGPGANLLTISGGGTQGLFVIDSGSVSISGLTLANGLAMSGGAIANQGALTIASCVFTNDVAQGATQFFHAQPGQGGAIYNASGAKLTVTGSTFSQSSAIGGKGMAAFRSPAGDGGSGQGGAIFNAVGAQLSATDDTFASDSALGGPGTDSATNFVTIAGAYGGAIYNAGTAAITNSTLDGGSVQSGAVNSSGPLPPLVPTDGAEIYNDVKATLLLINTIAADGKGGSDIANQGIVTGDHNLVMKSVGVAAGVILSTVDPKLGPLQNNGGPTPTMALQAGSPAIDVGNNSYAPATDQRGLTRIAGNEVDLGAYEADAPYLVTSTADSGPGTLRDALGSVASYAGSSQIVFSSLLAGQTITLQSELLIQGNITIDGAAAPGLVIAGSYTPTSAILTGSVFDVAKGATATIRNVSISGGGAQNGGGIDNHGVLTVFGDTIENNFATNGGGIYNDGTLRVIDSTLTGNAATAGLGGGIDSVGTLTLLDSTIANNSVSSNGNGGGLAAPSGSATLHNSIIADNTAGQTGPDVFGAVISQGRNLIGNAAGASGLVSSDLTGRNPLLGSLGYNGGPTPTLALLAGSPAIGSGDPSGAPATDQRGFARVFGSTIDIGSYERQSYDVTSTLDSGPGTLRQALTLDRDGSTITIDPSLSGQTIALATELLIQNSVSIDGTGAPGIVLSGNNATRVFHIGSGATVMLRGLTIEQGSAATGAGILNAGNLTLSASTIAWNDATSNGGGIENTGTLTVVDSTIANNTAGGALTTSTASGGGIDNVGTLTILDSTIAGNAAGHGGGVNEPSTAVLSARDSIFAGNSASISGPDLLGNLGSLGHNIILNPAGGSGFVVSDLQKVNPMLGSLQSNGGPTPTESLLPSSPAIDSGDATSAPTTDERGLPRIVNGVIDIGAFELQLTSPAASAGTGYMINTGQSLTLLAPVVPDQSGDVLTYTWDINGDGTFGDATGPHPTLTWAQLQALGIGAGSSPYLVRVRVSDGFGGDHTVTSPATSLAILPLPQLVSITPAAPGPRNTPLGSVIATFSSPINVATLNSNDISLTLNGGANLITSALQVSPVSNSTYSCQITGLGSLASAQGTYVLSIDGTKVASPTMGVGAGQMSISWLMDTTAPTSHVLPLPATQSNTAISITVTGNDPAPRAGEPASGITAFDIYISGDGGPFIFWTSVSASNPTAIFSGQSGNTYAFRSVAHDAAGNFEAKPAVAEATTSLVDTTPPSTQVTSVNAQTSTLQVAFSGSDTGGSGLKLIIVLGRVDDGAVQLLTVFTAGASSSGTASFPAMVDGRSHSYQFFTLGIDGAGNVESVASCLAKAVTATATFSPPAPATPPVAMGIMVQNGMAERSYIQSLDILFNQTGGVASLITGNHIHLYQHNLNGQGTTPVSLNGVLSASGNMVGFNFGAAGLGGNPNSTAGDGYYEVDIDGSSKKFFFDRLLGDVNGDHVVNNTDVKIVMTSLNHRSPSILGDVNGDGVANATDLSLVKQAKNHRLKAGLHLDA
jgi:hypothetical protein